jgi:hypothetical protein
MFISIDDEGAPSLADVDNFRSFKVVLCNGADAAANSDQHALGMWFQDEHAYVKKSWLIQLAGQWATPDWISGLDAMIEKARSMGWITEGNEIRAHIERA